MRNTINTTRIPYIEQFELTLNKKPTKTLKGCLSAMTRNQLEYLLENYTNQYTPELQNKADIVEYLTQSILSTVVHYMYYVPTKVYEPLLLICNNRDGRSGVSKVESYKSTKETDPIFYLESRVIENTIARGYIFHFWDEEAGSSFMIPTEIAELIKQECNGESDNFGKWIELTDFTTALISRYGVVTVNDFKTLWNTNFPEKSLTTEQSIEHLSLSALCTGDYTWSYNFNAVYYKNFDEDQARFITHNRSTYPLYQPSKETVTTWMTPFTSQYYADSANCFDEYEVEHNNTNYKAMSIFLKNHFAEDGIAEEILYYIVFYIKNMLSMNEVLEIINEDYSLTESLSTTDFHIFCDIYQKLHNTIGHWDLYGWCPSELRSHNSANNKQNLSLDPDSITDSIIPLPDFMETTFFPKVGRNEPCPCGSGKKYKHCHGR